MKRIICVGNRFVGNDDAGVRVFDRLACTKLPEGIEVIDGGIAGLNLLGLIDGAERVVFVDAVSGFFPSGGVLVLTAADIPSPLSAAFDHAAGIPYLFSIIPHVCDVQVPDLYVVGIEGSADEAVIDEAARISVRVAEEGCRDAAAVKNSSSGGKHDHVH